MNSRRLVVSLMVMIMTTGVLAHHGTSITYEMDKTITVTGTVDEFDFSYPHPSLFVDVADEKGRVVKWGVEFLPTPAALKSLGWNKTSIKAGDKVEMGCHPSKVRQAGVRASVAHDQRQSGGARCRPWCPTGGTRSRCARRTT